MSDSLFERGKSLEDNFFRETDRKLLDKLRGDMEAHEACKALAAVCGITDEEVLNQLVQNNVTAESITSVSLIPLIAVAWADRFVERREREAILKAAHEAGIEEGTACHDLVESWLNKHPPEELFDSWKAYVGALKKTLDETAYNQLKQSIMVRARDVALAAGGFLGIGSVSEAETRVLEDLEQTFG